MNNVVKSILYGGGIGLSYAAGGWFNPRVVETEVQIPVTVEVEKPIEVEKLVYVPEIVTVAVEKPARPSNLVCLVGEYRD